MPQVLGGSAAGIFSSVPPEYATGTGRGRKGPKGTERDGHFPEKRWDLYGLMASLVAQRRAEVQKDNSNQEKEAEEVRVAVPTGFEFRKCRPSEHPTDTNR